MIAWLLPAIAGVLLVALGVAGAHTGLVGPMQGFGVSLAGAGVLAVAAVVLVPLAIAAALLGKPWLGGAVAGCAVPLLASALLAVRLLAAPGGVFNDVTTDADDPPGIAAGPQAGVAYPPAFRALQADAFPGLAAVTMRGAPDAVFATALLAARRMPDWEIVHVDVPARTFQAVARSRVFRFPDDVVVRVRPDAGGGSRVDLRSRSRHGRGDLGANAARIERFLEALE